MVLARRFHRPALPLPGPGGPQRQGRADLLPLTLPHPHDMSGAGEVFGREHTVTHTVNSFSIHADRFQLDSPLEKHCVTYI